MGWNRSFVIGKVKKFELADNSKTDKLQPYINKILKALGCTDALVTDESYITDLIDVFTNATEKDKILKKLSKKLKVKISVNDYVWQVAERMYGKNKTS